MKLFKLLLFAFIYTSIAANLVFAGVIEKGEWINEDQPIPAGGRIYSMSDGRNATNYFYDGIENNHIRIRYYSCMGERYLTLPLNDNKQAVFKAMDFNDVKGIKLRITVVDDFGRIKVEKYKEE